MKQFPEEELDSDTREFLHNMREGKSFNIEEEDIVDTRNTIKELSITTSLPYEIKQLLKTTTSHHTIDVSNGSIEIRVHYPVDVPRKEPLPLMVFYHGGGWIYGDIDSYEDTVRYLCERSAAIIVNVGYRLAPEFPFPTAVEDCYAALCWTVENADKLGGNVDKLIVTGDSAGGNLAAAVCHLSKREGGPKIARQVLMYPVLENPGCLNGSKERYGNGDYILSNTEMNYMLSLYISKQEDLQDYRLFPLLADDFSDLPETLIVAAECDVLCVEGQRYAKKLEDANVKIDYQLYKGTVHGFVTFAGVISQGVQALDNIASYIKAMR